MMIKRRPWRFGWCVLLILSPAWGQTVAYTKTPINLGNVGPVEWTKDEGGNGHFYEAITTHECITWADAQKYAVSHGGYLATITSPHENLFVFKLVDSPQFWLIDNMGDSLGPWLGGICDPSQNPGGEPWQWVNNEGQFRYTNWSPLHNFETNQKHNALIFYGPGVDNRRPVWNNYPASARLCGFVVEYNTNPAPVPKYVVPWDKISLVGYPVVGFVIILVLLWFSRRTTELAGGSF
jgi:hypothetical protein